MIKDQVQKQEAGDGSTNLQGKSIVIHQGISYSDAKEIALDVYKTNFLQLSKVAKETAKARAEEITDEFLSKLKERNESAIDSMNDPAMQIALYEAQKQYAKTGDKDLEGLLVDILVERASTPERNIHQIVLDESLSVASKLTKEQMDALTINFLVSKTSFSLSVNLESLKIYLQSYIMPFTDNLTEKSSCYEHLDYVGCGSLMHVGGMKKITEIYQKQYEGFFSKGFTREKFEKDVGPVEQFPNLIINCPHNSELLQVGVVNLQALEAVCRERNVSEDHKKKLVDILISTKMSPNEIEKYVVQLAPETEKLFLLWNNSAISKFKLTTVGIAIAQANFRRKTGIKLDLTTWVN